MNKEYIYLDGKVIISDESGNKSLSDYCDNLDDILIQENIVETMENKIEKLQEESKSYEDCNKKHYVPSILIFFILFSIIGSPLISGFFNNSFTLTMHTIFGEVNKVLIDSIFMSTCMISFGSLMEVYFYRINKNDIKKCQGIKSELEFLDSQLKCEKDKLETLKQNKSRKNECTEFRTCKVNDIKELNALKAQLNFYYNLGYNLKEYYEYYTKGILDKKLQHYVSEDDLELIKQHLNEKGQSIILSKKSKGIQNNKS